MLEDPLRSALHVSVSVFLAEMGDKTMIATAAFSLTTNPLVALLYSSLAYFLANFIPVLLACETARALGDHSSLIQVFTGVGFAALGFLMLLKKGGEKEAISEGRNGVAYLLFLTASELGDKTQVASVLAAALTADALLALAAGAIGYFVANCFGVGVAQVFKNNLKPDTLRRISGVAFAIIGFYYVVTALL